MMELLTTVKDFAREASSRHLAPGTPIKVTIPDQPPEMLKKKPVPELPAISPEEQRHRLHTMPNDYDPESSRELTDLIRQTHLNTDTREL